MARIDDAFLNSYTSNAKTRQAELDALAAANATANANTIKALQELGVGGDPIIDTRAALAKLTSGQTLTDAEKRKLGMSTTTTETGNIASSNVNVPTRPDINNRNIFPTENPGEGYQWQWLSQAYANNPWGGEWRKVKISTSGSPGGSPDTTTQTTPNITLVSTETDEYGNVVGVYSDGSTKILINSGRKYKTTVDEDAYSILENTFKDFGLEELIPEIKKFMEAGLGSNQAAVELRKTQTYITRFKGNEIRRAAGLNVLSEAEYLALEDSYSQTLRAYGLQNYFGIDRKIKTAAMSDIIGNDISAIEFKDRIDTVVTRVNNADPMIKATLNSFYNITDTDLVRYFLNPKENLPKLQEKVTAAEIGSEALKQNLITGVDSATTLAQLGITKAKAAEGYAAIGQTLGTTQKLANIYGEEGINYTQTTAEEEVFKGLASAERKRKQLASREMAAFGGTSGVGKGSFGGAKGGAF